LVINALNVDGARILPSRPAGEDPIPYLDSSGDGFLSALDALLVINALNTQGTASSVTAVAGKAEADPAPVPEGEIGAHWSRFAAAVDVAFHQDDQRSPGRRFQRAHPLAGDELWVDPLRNAAGGEAT
jgi:hypothetical protein